MKSSSAAASLMLLLFSSCGPKPQSAVAEKRYPLTGEIVAVDAKNHTATVKHGPVGDWMGAMTMEYPLKSAADLRSLHVGEKIKATVEVRGDTDYVLSDIEEQGLGK